MEMHYNLFYIMLVVGISLIIIIYCALRDPRRRAELGRPGTKNVSV